MIYDTLKTKNDKTRDGRQIRCRRNSIIKTLCSTPTIRFIRQIYVLFIIMFYRKHAAYILLHIWNIIQHYYNIVNKADV